MQHINDLSLHIELPWTLSKAEGIYQQLMAVADQLPDNVRAIIGLEPLKRTLPAHDVEDGEASGHKTETNGVDSNSRRSSTESENVKLGDNEVSFERGINLSYM